MTGAAKERKQDMEKRPILKNKYYLYLTEFFAGMAVMAVELGASRLLAPYFSSSQIVWTIIIGTIMIAMALGNVWGGRSADRNPDPDRLYRRIIIAAVWIAAIPLLGRYIILGVSGLLIFTVDSNFLVIAAFAACMIIFVFPLFLLGTVTPSLVKYTTDNLEENGKIVGTLGAFNTIGSIIGTFLPTFVTIPAVGTAVTYFFGNSAAAGSDLFPEFEGEAKDVCRSAGRLYVLQHFREFRKFCILGKRSAVRRRIRLQLSAGERDGGQCDSLYQCAFRRAVGHAEGRGPYRHVL